MWRRRSPHFLAAHAECGSTCRSPTASWIWSRKASTWRCASARPGADNLVARKLGETRLVPCASPAYLEAHGAPQDAARISRGHNCFTYEYVSAAQPLALSRPPPAPSARCACAGTLHSNNGDLLAEVAARGAGIVFEPAFIVGPDVRAGRLVPLLQEFEPPPMPIYAVYPSRKHLSAKVRLLRRVPASSASPTRRTGALREMALPRAGCAAFSCAGAAPRMADRRAAARSWPASPSS